MNAAGLPRFFTRRTVPLYLQAEAAECGPACLAMIAAFYGNAIGVDGLRGRFAPSQRGLSLSRLMQMAEQLGLAARAVRLEPAELPALRLPAILHWRLDHFVVLERLHGAELQIVDPAVGRRRIPAARAARAFTGIALELQPARDFRRKPAAPRLTFRQLAARVPGLIAPLAAILAVSLALQTVLLVMPLFAQLVVDQVAVRGERDLLNLLALGFGLLAVMQAAFGVFRSWLVAGVATRCHLHWLTEVFRHLLRLPLDWFGKRRLGDIQSRFGSLAVLQQLLSRQVVEAVVDGAMALLTLAVMYAYSPLLAGVVTATTAACLLLRCLFYPAVSTRAREALAAGARRDSYFLESLRGIQAIKSCGAEAARECQYRNRLVEAWNAGIRGTRLSIWQAGVTDGLLGLQLVLVVWLAGGMIMDGRLTAGMLVAFLAYRALFSQRAATLLETVFRLRLSRVQLERLADIVLAEPEAAFRQDLPSPSRRARHIALAAQSLTFRYAADELPVVDGLTVQVAAGEHVVLTGPSGSGKTTALKLLMGLLSPESGSLRVNGVPLNRYGIRRYRRELAAVMQDDLLFNGSLQDNISFFEPSPDPARVRDCARLAELHAVIEGMPLGYLTRVGDMGSSLSGGQCQRLLLARALYRRPRILFLDEFTNQLDEACEQRICNRLTGLGITLVVVAHRATTIARADREIHLGPVTGRQCGKEGPHVPVR